MSRSRKSSAHLGASTSRGSSSSYRSVSSQMTPAHVAAVEAAAHAELRGDAAEAFLQHRSVPMFAQSTHGDLLGVLAAYGDAAPGWLVNRWLAVQARRPHWRGGSEARLTRALPLALEAAYPDGIHFEAIDCDHPRQVVPFLVGRDWVVRQIVVYELGGLRDVVEHRATSELLARADQVTEWCSAPMGGYRLAEVGDGVLTLVDLADNHEVEVLDLGLAELTAPGESLIGRLVPTSVSPGRMFESRPLAVGADTAAAVASSPRRWPMVLRMKARAGRLPAAFSYQDDTSLTTDLPWQSWLTLVGHTPGDRFPAPPHHLAQQAVTEVLHHAEAGRLHEVRHRAGDLMSDPLLGDAVLARCADPGQTEAWLTLAAVVPVPARRRCLEMAMWCDAGASEA